METPTFYLETSVWGSLGLRQPQDRRRIVRSLLKLLDGHRGICCFSAVVAEEIERAVPETTRMIQEEIEKMAVVVLPITDAAKGTRPGLY